MHGPKEVPGMRIKGQKDIEISISDGGYICLKQKSEEEGEQLIHLAHLAIPIAFLLILLLIRHGMPPPPPPPVPHRHGPARSVPFSCRDWSAGCPMCARSRTHSSHSARAW